MNRIIVLIWLMSFSLDLKDVAGEPLAIVVVMRLGAKAPIMPYPTDPYNISFWPNGWGNLTDMGYKQQFELGKWLGERYRNIFGETYSQKNINILSSNFSSTILSAKAALTGVFSQEQIHRNSIIEIELHGKKQDNLIAGDKPCRKLTELKENLSKSEELFKRNDEVFYEHLRNVTNFPVYNFTWAFFLYDNLESESKQNFTLPEWTKGIYPQKFDYEIERYYLLKTYNPVVSRLEVGPLWNRILSFFSNYTSNPSGFSKVLLISAHQHNLVNILRTIDAYDDFPPSFSSCLIFELHQNNDRDFYIQTFLKNETVFIEVNWKDCGSKCKLFDVFRILKVINISQKDWNYECNVIKHPINTVLYIFIVVLLTPFICLAIYFSLRMKRKGKPAFLLVKQLD